MLHSLKPLCFLTSCLFLPATHPATQVLPSTLFLLHITPNHESRPVNRGSCASSSSPSWQLDSWPIFHDFVPQSRVLRSGLSLKNWRQIISSINPKVSQRYQNLFARKYPNKQPNGNRQANIKLELLHCFHAVFLGLNFLWLHPLPK